MLLCAVAGVCAVVCSGAQGTAPPRKAPSKSGAAPVHATGTKRPVAAARTTTAARPVTARTTGASTRTASSRVAHKTTPAPSRTWRARQMAPAPERYKEIQDALVTKGYLSPQDANGSWNTSSTEALKRFQGEQNLDASGKINSLSLIALGLGPKHDTAFATFAPAAVPAQDMAPSGR